MERVTKQSVVSRAIEGRPVFQKKLIRDILLGSVDVPDAWLQSDDRAVLKLDETTLLDPIQEIACKRLADSTARFVGVIALMSSACAKRYRAAADGLDPTAINRAADAISRGRGASTIRNVLLQHCPSWPTEMPEDLWGDVDQAIAEKMAVRERTRAGPTPEQLAQLFGPRAEQLDRDIRALAARSPDLADVLASEIWESLISSVTMHGRLPEKLDHWLARSSKRKLRALRRAEQIADLPPDSRDAHEPEAPSSFEPESAHTRVVRDAMPVAAARARLDADRFRRATPPRERDAMVRDVMADLLETGDANVLLHIVKRSEIGKEELDRRVPDGFSVARRAAIGRNIQDLLEKILREVI